MIAAAGQSTVHQERPSGRYVLATAALLGAGALAHLCYLIHDCPLDLSGDEAHYWEWSRRLDWSYYSKGPLVAYIIAASRAVLAEWSQRLVGSEALAVRVPALLLSVGTGLGIYTLAAQTTRSLRLALAAVALTFSIPILTVGAVLMTIDAPLALVFVWALVAVERGLRGEQTWPWLLAGVLTAVGILAKFTMLLIFPMVCLALLVEPAFRPALRRRGPYLMAMIGLFGLVPIVAWNARHDWVSFRHVAGQAGLSGPPVLDPLGPLAMLAGQAAVVGPVWFGALLCAVFAVWRKPAPELGQLHNAAAMRFLLCATVTPWLVFLAFSLITKIQPNWPVLALLPGTVVLACWLGRWLRASGRRRRLAGRVLVAAGAALGVASVVLAHHSEWLLPAFAWLARNAPPWELTPIAKYDPSARLRGWSQLGKAVGRWLEAERSAHHGGVEPFLVSDDYQTASQIAFYCPGQPAVYCLQAALGRRQSQYDIWRPNPILDPEAFVGRPCIYVGALKPELTASNQWSHAVLRGVRLAETVEHRVGGHLLAVWPVYVCEEFAGLPPGLERASQNY